MSLEDEVKALKLEVAALRKEMGPVVDAGAAPIHERIAQINPALNTVVNLCEGIPREEGGIRKYIDSRLGAAAPSAPAPSTTPTPPAPTPNPAPSAGTIPPLSAGSIAKVIEGMTNCSQGYDWQPAFLVRVKTELNAGKYSLCDRAFIDALEVYYYSPCVQGNPAYRDAMNGYLAIVDQRDPVTKKTYPAGDSRIKQVSGTATPSTPAPSTGTTPSTGSGLTHIGGSASSLASEQGYRQALLSIAAGDIGSGLGGDAAILFTARSPIVSHIMYATGGDRGWRFWYNMKPIGDNQLATSDPTLGQIAHQYEQDGSVSWTYFRPQNTPAGPYDGLLGKSLTIYPGGFNTAQTGKNVLVGGGQKGRGLTLGVTVNGSNNPTPMVQMDADGNANPVSLYAEGAPQRVVVKVVGGVKVFAPA